MSEIPEHLLHKIEPIFSKKSDQTGKDWWASPEKRKFDLDVANIIIHWTPYFPIVLATMGANYIFNGSPTLEKVPMHHPKYGSYNKVKIRSMVPNAHELERELARKHGGLHNLRESHDPRITPFGKIIRKMSLDETTQIYWNVIKGESAMVGPREFAISEYETEIYPNSSKEPYHEYLCNLNNGMRTAVTGLAPITDRHLAPIHRVAVENYWGKHSTRYSDLNILARTLAIPIMFNGV